MLELDDYLIDAGNPVNWSHPAMLPGVRPVAWWMCLPAFMGGAKFRDLMSSPDLRVGNHGTLTNMVQGTASGWRGTSRSGAWGALQFDGSNDYTVAPTISYASAPWSIVMWCRANAALSGWASAAGCRLNSNTSQQSAYYLHVRRSDTGNYGFEWDGNAHAITDKAQVAAWPSDGGWHQLIGIVSSLSVSVGLDGVITASVSRSANFVADTGNTYFGAAYFNGAVVDYGNISVDDVRIYNRALTAPEVRSLYDSSRAGYPGVLRRLSVPMSGAVSVGGGRIVGSSIVRGLMGGIGRAA